MAEYEGKFTKLSKYAPELVINERKRIRRFLEGLNVEIQERLAIAQISTFTEPLEKAQGCKLGTSILRKGTFLVIPLDKLVKVPTFQDGKGNGRSKGCWSSKRGFIKRRS